MTETDTSDRVPALSNRRLPAVAAGAMALWIIVELTVRRGLSSVLAGPLGSATGADMLLGLLWLPAIAVVFARIGSRVGIDRDDWDYDVSVGTAAAGTGGVVAFFVLYFAVLIVLTAGFGLDPQSLVDSTTTGTPPTWALALLLFVNGVVVPIVEEFAWRGVVQTALTRAYGSLAAIGITAVAFVAKHVVVDMTLSPFRVAPLLVLAFVLCGLRDRYGTASSTVTHLVVNLVSTAALVAA